MMTIESIFKNNAEIPFIYTCLGANINPPLFIKGVPPSAQSLALLLEDMDTDPIWVHWHLYNIAPTISRIEAADIPSGAEEGLCNNHTLGYEGPCPKYFQGRHSYRFVLYALDRYLNLETPPEPESLRQEMVGSVITTAELWFYSPLSSKN